MLKEEVNSALPFTCHSRTGRAATQSAFANGGLARGMETYIYLNGPLTQSHTQDHLTAGLPGLFWHCATDRPSHIRTHRHTHTLQPHTCPLSFSPHASLFSSRAAEAERWNPGLSRGLKKVQVLWDKDIQKASSFFSALLCCHSFSLSISSLPCCCSVWASLLWSTFFILICGTPRCRPRLRWWTVWRLRLVWGGRVIVVVLLVGLPSSSRWIDESWRFLWWWQSQKKCTRVCVQAWWSERCLSRSRSDQAVSGLFSPPGLFSDQFRGDCRCALPLFDSSSFSSHSEWVTHSEQQVLYLSQTRGAAAACGGCSVSSLTGGSTHAATNWYLQSVRDHYVTPSYVICSSVLHKVIISDTWHSNNNLLFLHVDKLLL